MKRRRMFKATCSELPLIDYQVSPSSNATHIDSASYNVMCITHTTTCKRLQCKRGRQATPGHALDALAAPELDPVPFFGECLCPLCRATTSLVPPA